MITSLFNPFFRLTFAPNRWLMKLDTRIWVWFCIVVFFNACNSGNTSAKKIFRYNQSSGITSLDPAAASDLSNIWAVNQLFNSLLQLDDSLHVKPCIASRWKISDDGLTYTFYLRNDVYFHDDSCFQNAKGRRVTANDVVYSFNRLIDPKTAAKGSWIFNGRVDTSSAFTAISDSVFQLKLSSPFSPMLGILTMQYCSVIPHEAIEKYGSDFRSHPVGTGPFKFYQWKENVALMMNRNEHYFESLNERQLPLLDGVKISFIDNAKTEFISFRQGDLDFISGVDAAYIDEVLEDDGSIRTNWSNKYQVTKSPFLNTEYLCFLMVGANSENNPLLNKKVRQAINYAIDRQELITYLRNGIGKPATHGFNPYGFADFDIVNIPGYSFDLNKAKKMLAEAGFKDGVSLPEIKLYSTEMYKEYALTISKQLERAGIKLKVELVQSSLLKEMKAGGKAPFFRASLVADYADPETYFAAFYSKHIAPPNYTRFSNKRYDELYEKSVAEKDLTRRNEMYVAMENIIHEEVPIVPLYYDEALRITQKRVKGLNPNPLNLLQLKFVTLND